MYAKVCHVALSAACYCLHMYVCICVVVFIVACDFRVAGVWVRRAPRGHVSVNAIFDMVT